VIEPHYGRVEGSVVNPDGTPAANVAVDLCGGGWGCEFTGKLAAITGPDGAFGFDNVRIGRFLISAKSQVSLNATKADGQLLFEGDVARVTLSLVGLSRVAGSVLYANGNPASNVRVVLNGQPSSGCPEIGGCIGFTDANGAFAFINVPARTFYLSAVDSVSGLSGAVSGALNPGDALTVNVVLQATASVSGRVLSANGSPAPGITAELVVQTGVALPVVLFQVTDGSGMFTFPAVPIGIFTLNLEDPIGPGVAHRSGQSAGAIALGDIILDEAPPSVSTLTPQASAVGVPREAVVRIVFSEPITAGTVSQSSVRLTGPVAASRGS